MDSEDDIEEGFCHIDVDVLIVGAGLAGLTTALKLHQKERSISIRILEASSEIGGQMVRCPLGELGGKWITTEQNHVYSLIRNLDVPLEKRRLTRPILERCWDLDYGTTASLAKFELQRYIIEMETKLYQFKRPKTVETKYTMEMNIDSKLFFDKSRNFMKNIVLLACGATADNVLYDDFMTICAGFGGISKFLDLYFLHPETLYEIDSRQLLSAFMENLQDVDIRKSRQAMEIRPYRDNVKVLDSKGEYHCASVVVLAIPWPEIVDLQNDPKFPQSLHIPEKFLFEQNYAITSLIARYPKNPWRTAGYSGTVYSESPFIIGYEYKNNIYCCLYVHQKCDRTGLDSKILSELTRYFGDEMYHPTELHMKTYPMSYVSSSLVFKQYDRIIWSSSEVKGTCHRGCLNGAVESGLKAAFKALLILRPQAVSWRDAAEIRCNAMPLQTNTTWIYRYTTSWNLYNFSFYGLLTAALAICFRYFVKYVSN